MKDSTDFGTERKLTALRRAISLLSALRWAALVTDFALEAYLQQVSERINI